MKFIKSSVLTLALSLTASIYAPQSNATIVAGIGTVFGCPALNLSNISTPQFTTRELGSGCFVLGGLTTFGLALSTWNAFIAEFTGGPKRFGTFIILDESGTKHAINTGCTEPQIQENIETLVALSSDLNEEFADLDTIDEIAPERMAEVETRTSSICQ